MPGCCAHPPGAPNIPSQARMKLYRSKKNGKERWIFWIHTLVLYATSMHTNKFVHVLGFVVPGVSLKCSHCGRKSPRK